MTEVSSQSEIAAHNASTRATLATVVIATQRRSPLT